MEPNKVPNFNLPRLIIQVPTKAAKIYHVKSAGRHEPKTREKIRVNCKQSSVCVVAVSWRVRSHGWSVLLRNPDTVARCGMNERVTLRSLRTSGTYAHASCTCVARISATISMPDEWRDDFEASKHRRWQAECLVTDRGARKTFSLTSANGSLCRNEFAYAGWLKGWEETEDQRGFAIRFKCFALRARSSAACPDGEFRRCLSCELG